MADDDSKFYHYDKYQNHHDTVKHSEEMPRYEHQKRVYVHHDRNNGYRNNYKQQPFQDFKERFKNVKIHLFILNCSAPLSPNDRDLWEQVFESLERRLSGRYDDNNVSIHVTDEPIGLHQICLQKLKRYSNNVYIHKTIWGPDKIESMRTRNWQIIKEMADIRDNDPQNIFPLIIAFNSEKNIPQMENFRNLSHEFNIKMIEKFKTDRFMYSPDFMQDNFKFIHKPNPHHVVDRKRPSRSDDHYEENQKVQRTNTESELLSPSPIDLPKKQHVDDYEENRDVITDREIIECEDPEIVSYLKEQRRIPSAFVDHEYYPNGDLWKITTIMIFPNKLYPDYDGEEEEVIN